MSVLAESQPITDPPRRADNLCALDTCRKPIQRPKVYQRGVDRVQFAQDPWCSTSCCRIWHGITDSRVSSSDGKGGKP